MYYPEEVVQQVIAANDIADVIGGYVHLKKSGASYMGLCPFHNEKTPSFSVHPGRQTFHCFGCGEGGNVITFLMKYENYSFQEALKVLADRAGIKLPEANYSEQAKARAKQREILLNINKDTATYYYRLLRKPAGRTGLAYFEKRGLSPETMQQFGLGYADGSRNDLIGFLKSRGYDDENILLSGVAAYDEKRGLHDKFWNRVIFPIMDVTNRVIGFGGRVMGDAKPKYLNSPETPVFDKSRNLYGLNIAKKNRCGYFILCEGYMDVIAMHQAGFSQAVASLGTSFTEGQAAVLKRYVKQVLLSYDSDNAGVTAALRNIGILKQAGITAKGVDLRPYKDPDEFMKGLGKEEFQKRLDNAENSFFYEIRQMESRYDLSDPASQTEFYQQIAKKLCDFENEIERENYIKAMAAKYFIPQDSLRRQVASYSRAGGGAVTEPKPIRPKSAASEARLSRLEEAERRNERILLTWICEDPDLYPQLKSYISPEDFADGVYRRAAEKYFSMLEAHYGDSLEIASGSSPGKGAADFVTPASVIAVFEDEEEQRLVSQLFETRLSGIENEKDQEKALKDVLMSLKRASLDRLMKTSGDPSVLNKIVRSRKILDEIRNARFTIKAR